MSLVSDPIISHCRRDHPAIFKLLCEFNYLPASYLHPSWRSKFFGGKLPDVVWSTPRVWPSLSELLLREMKLFHETEFTLPLPQHSYILLPPSRIARLAQHIGAILLGSKIRSSLARDEVLRWRERLGHEAFEFAMNRARLLPSAHLPQENKSLVNVESIGFSVLKQCCSDLPTGIVQRLLLKIPADSVPADVDPKQAKQLMQSVMLTLEGEWRSLFFPKTT
jgi:hypothetical protein